MIPTDGTRSQHGPTRRMRPSGDGSTSYPGARSADVSNFSSSRTILPETKGRSLEELGADNERSAATCLAGIFTRLRPRRHGRIAAARVVTGPFPPGRRQPTQPRNAAVSRHRHVRCRADSAPDTYRFAIPNPARSWSELSANSAATGPTRPSSPSPAAI
jgi:hypothetical protein